MNSQNFPSCCGASIVIGFEGDVDRWLTENLEKRINTQAYYGILNSRQMKKYADILRKHGWVEVCSSFSTHGKGVITMWAYSKQGIMTGPMPMPEEEKETV